MSRMTDRDPRSFKTISYWAPDQEYSVVFEGELNKDDTATPPGPKPAARTVGIQGDQVYLEITLNTCLRCGEQGHSRYICLGESKRFCSHCGLMGVMTWNCRCQVVKTPLKPIMRHIGTQVELSQKPAHASPQEPASVSPQKSAHTSCLKLVEVSPQKSTQTPQKLASASSEKPAHSPQKTARPPQKSTKTSRQKPAHASPQVHASISPQKSAHASSLKPAYVSLQKPTQVPPQKLASACSEKPARSPHKIARPPQKTTKTSHQTPAHASPQVHDFVSPQKSAQATVLKPAEVSSQKPVQAPPQKIARPSQKTTKTSDQTPAHASSQELVFVSSQKSADASHLKPDRSPHRTTKTSRREKHGQSFPHKRGRDPPQKPLQSSNKTPPTESRPVNIHLPLPQGRRDKFEPQNKKLRYSPPPTLKIDHHSCKKYLPILPDTCWRCGQRGHSRQRCRREPKLFCSRCGLKGVLSKNCDCGEIAQVATSPKFETQCASCAASTSRSIWDRPRLN